MSKRSKACEFPKETRLRILERDEGCIFCRVGYLMPINHYPATDIMHIIPRSHGGLGVEQNGVLGCRYHHEMMDNGAYRKPMIAYCKAYLKTFYPEWIEEKYIYRKEGI